MKKIETRTIGGDQFENILRGKETRALQTTANGGAVISENVAGMIVKKMEETSPVFSMARKFNSESGYLKIAKETTTSSAGFIGEGLDVLESQINLDEIKLNQKRVGSALTLSNQLLNDSSVNLSEYARDLLARRMAKAIEKSILVGEGGEEFEGIKNAQGIIDIETDGIVNIDKLAEMHLSIHPEFLNGSVYIMNRTFFNLIAKLKDRNDHYYMQNGVVNGKFTYTLFGFNVVVSDALDAEVPCVFGNIQEGYGMMIKDDFGLTEVSTDTAQALRGSKLFVMDAYLDGAVYNDQALVRLKAA